MTGWRKVRTVAVFEFLSTVKRPGYLIATFGMPLFMAAYAAVVAVPAYYAEQQDRGPAVHGVVDLAGVLGLTEDQPAGGRSGVPDDVRRALEAAGQGEAIERLLTSGTLLFRPFDTETAAREALARGAIRGYFVLPADYLSEGRVLVYSGADASVMSGADPEGALGDLIRRRLVAGRVQSPIADRILRPADTTERFAVTRSGEIRDGGGAALALRLVVPVVFMVLFLLSVLMTSGYLMQGTATEKENKVVEVLLASANPDEILAGKLLGLGSAGLLQIGIWLGMTVATGIGVLPLLLAARMEFPWMAVVLAVPFFIVAFLFFGSLILGTGSLGANMREAQQLAMVWSLTAALPLMLLVVLLREPNGTLARLLTWIPFTSGPVVVLRASADAAAIAWWEVGGAFAVLVFATWVALHVGGRLFRIGLLSVGSRPSLREIARQARITG